jgi:toxin HigB-1
VIVSFAEAGTEDLFHGRDTGSARRTCPGVEAVARRKLDQLNQAEDIRDMAAPPGNRLERLRGDRAGQWSVPINDQYRLCFTWQPGRADDVEITDYH